MFKNKEKFIIESTPQRFNIIDEDIKSVANHINNGIDDGLSMKEVKILLEWLVENARHDIENIIDESINTNSCKGFCGFAQLSTIMPVTNCNITVTANNTDKFSNSLIRHHFVTIILPTKENDKIVNKWYLIDPTYRQFFEKNSCKGKNKLTSPGYFMLETNETLKLAKQLLKNGYIELTDDNLKMYSNGFICASGHNKNNIDVEKLKDSILNNQENIDCSREESLKFGCNPFFPHVKYEDKIKDNKER